MEIGQMGTQPLETPRLVLRRFTVNDSHQMFNTWANDPKVTRWMRWSPHKDVNETRGIIEGWVADYEKPTTYLWAMALKDGTLIGSIGVLPFAPGEAPEEGAYEPGYNIARPYWGKGYTSEALAAVVAYFVGQRGGERLYCMHAAGNPASGRVMQKCGFVRTGDVTYTLADGTPTPAWLYRYRPGAGPTTPTTKET